ncbi:large exoprotein [Microbacterium rhizomatis]|uniref:Large exoprotein n=1 Tax=Microbacterium rhizomatis TaxID=1631477 RepID=A0A5J5IZ56_9MICO|nr:large exoprotein [Microbacterium rhizomatis]KAA9105570.1 large exoprotein [Microbacterium rhizomatis]
MGGQVLGGGVVVLVAALLWLVYLLPSWHSRHQYDAAERNAVRLNQALRVLAETSETPQEVRLELNARTALAQQRLARRTQNERGLADLEAARRELAAARALPAARQARARRRARLITTILGLAAVAGAIWGGWQVVATGSQVVLWSAVALAVVCGILLNRMSRVNARVIARETGAEVAPRRAVTVQDLALGVEREVAWTPRELPRPLTASAGSRASAVLDQAAAREALRVAAQEERMRELEAELKPASIDRARVAREEAESERFRRMGHVDDAEIEAHVRQLLQRRAANG